MRKINIIIFSVLIILNTLIGLIMKDYKVFNFLSANFILILHFILRWIVLSSNTKDAFKISHSFITSFLTILTFILAVFLPNYFENNIRLILLFILIGIQFIITLSSLLFFKKEIL